MISTDIRTIVRKHFRERVKNHPFCPSELRTALRAHERVPVVIDNVTRDIYRSEQMNKIKLTSEDIKDMVYSATDLLIALMIKRHEMTQWEKMIAKEQSKGPQKVDKLGLDEQGNGYVEELGVVIGDKEQEAGATHKVPSGILQKTH